LWHVSYTSAGQLFYEALDRWHGDATEFENDAASIEGNICMGVWKSVGQATVQLSHVGWNFDPNGNPIGYFTLAETNRLGDDGNHYSGKFDYRVFEPNGVLQSEVTGTQTAVRIAP